MKHLLLTLFLVSGTILAQPKIEIVGGDTYHWGKVKPIDSPLRTRAIIKNTGDEVLRIFRVEPGCGCTTAPLSNDYIQPGDSAELDINLQIRNNKVSLHKKIDIYTNDPRHKIFVYNLKADIFVPLEAEPNFFAFNSMKVGEETVAYLSIVNNTDKAITIKKIISSHEDVILDINAEDVIPANGKLKVKATYVPTRAGAFNASMTLMTDSIDLPRMQISAYGNAEAN